MLKAIFEYFVIMLSLIANISRKIETCETPIDYYYRVKNMSIFHNFERFDKLTNCKQPLKIEDSIIEFIANAQIVIDDTFRVDKIIKNYSTNSNKVLIMIYFNGIDIESSEMEFYQLFFAFSKLDIYSNDSLIKANQCNKQNFNKTKYFFANFYTIKLVHVNYPEYLCPLIFSNSYLFSIYFDDISNSYLKKNRLNFIDVDDRLADKNEPLINELVFTLVYDSLTLKNLNRYAFKNVNKLSIYGYLSDIQTDLFGHFNIQIFDFLIDNYKDFFNKGNKWMKYLNNKVRVNLSISSEMKNILKEHYSIIRFQFKKNYSIIDQIYEYPDEDFCLFQHFPHDHLVFPMIVPGKKIKCSCTVLWLVQYYSYYININYSPDYFDNYDNIYNYDSLFLNKTILYCHDENFYESIKKCNFTNRLFLCKAISINQTNDKEDFYDNTVYFKLNNNVDLLFLIKWLQFILNIICQPILATLGIINNILTIIIMVHRSNRNMFKDKIYTHLIINSVFNILFCIICLFKLVNECLFFNTSIYCSGLYITKTAQYFKIIVIYFIGTIIKFCKNLTLIAFTFSRYVFISNKSNRFFTFFDKMNFKLYIFIILLTGSVLNLYKLFQYEVMEDVDPSTDFPKEIYNEEECNKLSSIYCSLFNSLKILNSFINDILFFVINFVIDLTLLNQYGKFLIKKAKIKKASVETETENKKQKKRITRMVIIVSTLLFISHFPEFISSILMLAFSKRLSGIFDFNLSTNLINEEAQVFTLISISCQFFIFLKFNKKFYVVFKCMIMSFFRKKTELNL